MVSDVNLRLTWRRFPGAGRTLPEYPMEKELFDQLAESLEQAVKIHRGEAKSSREFVVSRRGRALSKSTRRGA